jgi:hypothetical protein
LPIDFDARSGSGHLIPLSGGTGERGTVSRGVKDQTGDQRGGSEWEPIKILPMEMDSPTR